MLLLQLLWRTWCRGAHKNLQGDVNSHLQTPSNFVQRLGKGYSWKWTELTNYLQARLKTVPSKSPSDIWDYFFQPAVYEALCSKTAGSQRNMPARVSFLFFFPLLSNLILSEYPVVVGSYSNTKFMSKLIIFCHHLPYNILQRCLTGCVHVRLEWNIKK